MAWWYNVLYVDVQASEFTVRIVPVVLPSHRSRLVVCTRFSVWAWLSAMSDDLSTFIGFRLGVICVTAGLCVFVRGRQDTTSWTVGFLLAALHDSSSDAASETADGAADASWNLGTKLFLLLLVLVAVIGWRNSTSLKRRWHDRHR